MAALCIKPASTVRQALETIDINKKGVALVVDERGRLLDTINDGDIRRTILDGHSIDEPYQVILEVKRRTVPHRPFVVQRGTSEAEMLRIMNEHGIRQLPIVDVEGRVVDLVTQKQLSGEIHVPVQALIMAGGQGTRLRPHTEQTPKPMLPVGGTPLMEIMINQLKRAGIHRVNISTHYLADKITDYFKDGSDLGVEINYVAEDRPLGTAGAIRLIEDQSCPILVINGDVLSNLDFASFLAFHRDHSAELTVAVRQYEMQVPYGVVECEGIEVRTIREKPIFTFFVNAGIYLIEPSVYEHISSADKLDMPHLIRQMLQKAERVVSFPVIEYWVDIGRPSDYEQANQDVKAGKWTP